MSGKKLLLSLLTAVMLISIMTIAGAANADEGGCSIESNPEAQSTGDPRSISNMANADANLDGAVNVVDAMFIAQYAVGARTW